MPPKKEVSFLSMTYLWSCLEKFCFLGGLSPVSKLSGFSESDLYPAPPPPTPASAALSQTQLAHKTTPAGTPTSATPILRKTLPAHLTKPTVGDVGGRGTQASPSHDTGTRDEGVTNTDEKSETPPINGQSPAEGISPTNDVTDPGKHSRNQSAHSNSDYFITPTSSPRLTPPSSPTPSGGSRPMRIGARVGAGKADKGRRHETFFSSLPEKFQDLELLEGVGQGEELVPSEQFLQCCEAVLPFFGEPVSESDKTIFVLVSIYQ